MKNPMWWILSSVKSCRSRQRCHYCWVWLQPEVEIKEYFTCIAVSASNKSPGWGVAAASVCIDFTLCNLLQISIANTAVLQGSSSCHQSAFLAIKTQTTPYLAKPNIPNPKTQRNRAVPLRVLQDFKVAWTACWLTASFGQVLKIFKDGDFTVSLSTCSNA